MSNKYDEEVVCTKRKPISKYVKSTTRQYTEYFKDKYLKWPITLIYTRKVK